MKNEIIRYLRGNGNYKAQIIIRSDEDSYNDFPMHICLLILFSTAALIQGKWNVISILSTACIIINLSIIFYRLGYQDMKRQTEMSRVEKKYHA